MSGYFRRLPLKPPQLAPTIKPLSFADLKKGKTYPPNAILWTEESFEALQRFLRDLHQVQEGGLPEGESKILPADVRPGTPGDAGNPSTGWSTGFHRHAAPTGMPVHIGVELDEEHGIETTLSRSDHRHEVEQWRTFGVTIDGEGGVPVAGFKGYVPVPYAGTVHHWTLEADQIGSCVIDIWKSRKTPVLADSICGSGKPDLSSEITATSLPTGWTETTLAEGDILGFNLDSSSVLSRITLIVTVREE